MTSKEGSKAHISLSRSTSKPALATSLMVTQSSSLLLEKPVRARSSIPILQSQSAENRLEFSEVKSTSAGLRAKIRALQSYESILLQKHAINQAVILSNEKDLVRVKSTSQKEGKSEDKRYKEVFETFLLKMKQFQDTRFKHIREMDLFKRSIEEKDRRSGVEGNTVMELMKNQLEIYETQLNAQANEEKDVETRYAAELEHLKLVNAELSQELLIARQARIHDFQTTFALERKIKILENVTSQKSQRKPILEDTQESAKDILLNLKMKLGNGARFK